jgi:putative Mg2+ transporter-C (MgtC) family protein
MPTEFTTALSAEFSDIDSAAEITRIAVRLVLAAILGGVVGFEREITGKSAGTRTHMLVALGAALFVLAPLEHGAGAADISRVIQGLVAGIGFLGAGAIVHTASGKQNKGLTTAAGIWTTAALGMTAALGHGGMAIVATLLAVAILHLLPGGGPDAREKTKAEDAGDHDSPPSKIPDPANPASLRSPK